MAGPLRRVLAVLPARERMGPRQKLEGPMRETMLLREKALRAFGLEG